MRKIVLILIIILSTGLVWAETEILNISEKVEGMTKYDGFFTYYWDDIEGKIWLELTPNEEEFLYVNSLPNGIGSNDIGLDRGQLHNTRVVYFKRVGPKILMIEPNYSFRAESDNKNEQRAVRESFAFSTLYGFEVAAQTGDRVLVDASSFLLRDAGNVARSLKRSRQGFFSLENSRSVIDTDGLHNFPDNSEISAMLTFTADSAGSYLWDVVPTPEDLTIIQRHSFIRLPDDNYKPRVYDLRSGYFGISYMDFATPIGKPITKRFIRRHRLEKKDKNAKMSEAVEPIVYYVDNGAPEPIRSALVEGASWWNEAFEAAGYKDAFQVRVLPDGADPLDVRYNMIQWVHRSSRGWSYGSAITDPRTGEIIKGHVSLGSLRVRQDFLIAEGILGSYTEEGDMTEEMLEMSFARIRQLSAHEVGHTIGLSHNFAASTNGRASVMDYPYPLVKLNDKGEIDLSDAYDSGIGEWDKAAVTYGYMEIPEGIDEKDALNKQIEETYSLGLKYLSDSDARSSGSVNPRTHLWDNGENAVDELNRIMKVRRHLLDKFSEENLAYGQPMALLEETLVPIYMFHRYQIAAAAKVIGGLEYEYAVRDGNNHTVEMVKPIEQREAIKAMLKTITAEALILPENVIKILPPHTSWFGRDRESFNSRTGMAFDPVSAAESVADMTVRLLLHPQRASRLVEYHSRDSKMPSLEYLIDELVESTLKMKNNDNLSGEINRMVSNLVLNHIFNLASDNNTSRQVRAIAFAKIDELSLWIDKNLQNTKSSGQKAHLAFMNSQIKLFKKDPDKFQIYNPVNPPAGSPIGFDDDKCGYDGCSFSY